MLRSVVIILMVQVTILTYISIIRFQTFQREHVLISVQPILQAVYLQLFVSTQQVRHKLLLILLNTTALETE